MPGDGSSGHQAAALDEAQFLRQQAQQARQAMTRTLELAALNLTQGVDPRAWARQHPWLTVGAAAAGGFLAAVTLVPMHRQQLLGQLARIERAIAAAAPQTNGLHSQAQSSATRLRLLRRLLRTTLKLVQPALWSAIAAGMTAKATADPPPPQTSADDSAATPGHGHSPMSQ